MWRPISTAGIVLSCERRLSAVGSCEREQVHPLPRWRSGRRWWFRAWHWLKLQSSLCSHISGAPVNRSSPQSHPTFKQLQQTRLCWRQSLDPFGWVTTNTNATETWISSILEFRGERETNDASHCSPSWASHRRLATLQGPKASCVHQRWQDQAWKHATRPALGRIASPKNCLQCFPQTSPKLVAASCSPNHHPLC